MKIDKTNLGKNPWNQPRKLYHKITKIIIHHSAGNSAGSLSIGNGSRKNVSFHYDIDKDGTIRQYVDENKIAYHCGGGEQYFEWVDNNWGVHNLNPISIGIELVNYGNRKDPYPEVQIKALIELVQHLMRKYNISADNVIGHKELTKNKIDPSSNFFEGDMEGFRKFLKATYVEQYNQLGKVKIFNGFNNEPITGGEVRELIEVGLYRLLDDLKNRKLKFRGNKNPFIKNK